MPLPKIILIHTGGTLGMRGGKPGHLKKEFQACIDSLMFMGQVADLECDVLCDIDSSDMSPKMWQELARHIDQKFQDDDCEIDGIVVVHGTDTLAWTAAALSFMFSGLPCPIVVTGSQRPIEVPRSDAPRNLLNAVEAAIKGPKEVMVVFGDKILKGCAATKDSVFQFDAFRSNNNTLVGHIGLDVIIHPVKRRKKHYWFDGRIDSNVSLWSLIPGEGGHTGMILLNSGVKAMIIAGFGAGNVPVKEPSVLEVLEEARSRKVPVVLTTQCRHGLLQPDLYEGGREALKRGAIFASGMSLEAIQVKMMVMLGRKVPYSKFAKEFRRNWAGEIV